MDMSIPHKGLGPDAGNGAGLCNPFKNGGRQGDFIQNVANAFAHNAIRMSIFYEIGAVMDQLAGD